MRAFWTYHRLLSGRRVTIDVDVVNVREAAAAHWRVARDEVEVGGQRRWWMRWIARTTHEVTAGVAVERSWWLWSRFALGVVV